MHSVLSLWLALLYAALVIYASLYPFAPWHDQGLVFWRFLATPLPPYWSRLDVLINVLGYMPLGALLALRRVAQSTHRWRTLRNSTLIGAALAFVMESLQTYLPLRVSSNLDWMLNVVGTFVGAGLIGLTHSMGLVGRWRQWRDSRLDAANSSASWSLGLALSLLLLWPLLLLYPSPTPLGLGHVFDNAVEPAQTYVEILATASGLLMPLLLAFAITPQWRLRLMALVLLLCLSLAINCVTTGLIYGAASILVWLSESVALGLASACAAALLLLALPPRWCWALLTAVGLVHVLLVNAIPMDPYYAQHLSEWEAGRFVRFYGITELLSAAWPFVLCGLALVRLVRH